MTDALAEVLKSPGAFALATLKAFRKNQGLLLAGAVAYYALLSTRSTSSASRARS